MKIGSLVSSIDPAIGSGVSEAVINLTKYLNKIDNVSTILYSLKHRDSKINFIPGITTNLYKYYDPLMYGYSPLLKKEILNSNLDILHTHGIWEYNSYISLSWKKRGGKYLMSPNGMLNPWAMDNSKLKKKIFYNLLDKKYIQQASVVHVLNYNEYESVRELGFKNPISIIPYGIDLPILRGKNNTDAYKLTFNKKVLLYVGRIHPIKGLINLLKAVHNLQNNKVEFLQKWLLIIVGWGRKQHVNELKKNINSLNISKYVKYLGPLFNEKKHDMYRIADAFIIPSFSEGLPMVVLEAWAYGLPVLMTPYCNIPEGFVNNAAIEILPEAESIEEVLKKMFLLDKEELIKIGENGRRMVESKFSWSAMAKDMKEVYEWILGDRDKPETVILN